MPKLAAKSVTFCVKVKGDAVQRSHWGHLGGWDEAQSLIHLGTKFNCKRQPTRIILWIDPATGARVAIKSQDVFARMEQPRRNRKMRFPVGIAARDLQLQ